MASKIFEGRFFGRFPPQSCFVKWSEVKHGYLSLGQDARTCLSQWENETDHPFLRWQIVHSTPKPLLGLPEFIPDESIRGLLKPSIYVEAARALISLHSFVPKEIEVGPFLFYFKRNIHKKSLNLAPFRIHLKKNPSENLVQTQINLKNGLPFYLGLGKDGPGKLVLLVLTYLNGENDV